jgi:hypothetical protein
MAARRSQSATTARIHDPIRRPSLTNTPDVAGLIALEVVKLVAVIVVLLILARGKTLPSARTPAGVCAFDGIGLLALSSVQSRLDVVLDDPVYVSVQDKH